MAIKLSVCIPTYNRAMFLGETLESIVNQATEEVEIVVSDNASTDNTEEIVEQYRKIFPQITYYRQLTNAGADRNYLKVVELAAGEYCWLFGSDDVMKENAIAKILGEIGSGGDLYLCGLTLCDFDMKPVLNHRVLKIKSDMVFDLGNDRERLTYFELAETTTAFFSFLGSLIVKKKKWDAVEIDEDLFIGSLWSHVAKILGMLPLGLRVKYLHDSLLNKRGDNDSFMDRGIVKRYGVAIEGFNRIGSIFFGTKSPEAYHLRRVVRYELPLNHLLNAKLMCCEVGDIEALDELNRLVDMHYADHQLVNLAQISIYRWMPLSLYSAMKKVKKHFRQQA